MNSGQVEIPEELRPLTVNLEAVDSDDFPQDFVQALVNDLLSYKGKSIIAAGEGQPAAVHAIAGLLNSLLGNVGNTVLYTPDETPTQQTSVQALQELTQEMQSGDVNTLVIIGGNPVYEAPADLDFAAALQKVPNTIHLSLYNNETSQLCTWQVPRAHYLESWGDTRSYDGQILTVQPLIYPLYEGLSTIEFLDILLGNTHPNGYELVRQTLGQFLNTQNFEEAWQNILFTGVVPESSHSTVTPQIQIRQAGEVIKTQLDQAQKPSLDNTGTGVHAGFKVYDGRFANNGWLQELPDFMTKTTWDNFALVSFETARQLGIRNGELIHISHQDYQLTIPAYILPGHARYSITLPLGYGRTSAGRVGNNVGFNTYKLRTTAAMDIVTGAQVQGTGEDYRIADTQDHHFIDLAGFRAREHRVQELLQEATVEHYLAHPDFAKGHDEHHPPLISLWDEWDYTGHKWGMAIDLNSCIGCNACVVACQAENNIPVVGKDEVGNGREMHWLRVDRYFKGLADNPEVSHAPLMCVHCENAPGTGLPVGATMHDSEGLNVMVYNRCVEPDTVPTTVPIRCAALISLITTKMSRKP